MKDLRGKKVKEGDVLFYSEIMTVDNENCEYDFIDNKGNKANFIYADSILEVFKEGNILFAKTIFFREEEDVFISLNDKSPMMLENYSWDIYLRPTDNLRDCFVIEKQKDYLKFLKENIDNLHNEILDLKDKR